MSVSTAPDPLLAPSSESTRERQAAFTPRSLIWAVVPLVLLAAVLAWIVRTDAGLGDRTVPPIETLSVQRVVLPAPGQIELDVVNGGPDPITIAQVLVDEAYWQFSMEPPGTLDRLESARISIPYPWVEGESHSIALISSTGVLFETAVPVAIESPQANQESFLRFGLVGLYVGIVPVALGLLWYPFLRHLGRRGMNFVLALTVGLLAFLVVDMWEEAHETATAAVGALDAPVLIPLVALLTMGLLIVVGQALRRRTNRQEQSPLALAYQIALGIGLHNLGEGLAIGAAFALGEAALGVFLILGFTLHNVTEGIGIAAPLVRDRPRLRALHRSGAPGRWTGHSRHLDWGLCLLALLDDHLPRGRHRRYSAGDRRGGTPHLALAAAGRRAGADLGNVRRRGRRYRGHVPDRSSGSRMNATLPIARDEARITPAIEDYLKAIYQLNTEEPEAGSVTGQRIAERLGVAAPSVTNMIKRLSELGLVEHERYRGVELSGEGERIALEVVRHHRLLERYLVEALGYGWDEVHDEAERLEHHISEALEARMAAVLGDPDSRSPRGPDPTSGRLCQYDSGAAVARPRPRADGRRGSCLRSGSRATAVPATARHHARDAGNSAGDAAL